MGGCVLLRLAATAAIVIACSSIGAMGADIVIHDENSQPESLAAAPDGTLIVGSANSPFVYRVKLGASKAEPFINVSAESTGAFFLGQLADPATSTVWSCLLEPVPGAVPARRRSALVGSDIASGARKIRWDLPGDINVCNDFNVGPDKALYITDTTSGRIYRLAPGANTAELYLENRLLSGVDGITFFNDVMYVTNVFFNKLYRIPVDSSGRPGAPVDIWMDAPVKGPDGLRAANGKMFMAENAAGKIDRITVDGDTAHITVLRSGMKTPTAVEPSGNVIWVSERETGKAVSVPMPK
jgi:hypothetical protein